MMKKNEHFFHGMICIEIPMLDGSKISLLKWDSNSTEYENLSEVWIFDRENKKTCYITPVQAIDFFNIYHDFDEVIGSGISWNWTDSDHLEVHVKAANLTIRLSTQYTRRDKFINSLLRTPLKTILQKKGVTDTGMEYRHRSRKIRTLRSCYLALNQTVLTSLDRNSDVPISWGTHYLRDLSDHVGSDRF